MYIAHYAEVKEASSWGRPDRDKMEALKNNFEKEVKLVSREEQQKKFTAY